MPRFSFDTAGAKEKLAKENAAKEISPSAEGAKGYSPLTSQAFEKRKCASALTKTFHHFDSANTFVSKPMVNQSASMGKKTLSVSVSNRYFRIFV